ncbi:MAG: 2-phospho-L-lactate transferase CofD family protein, partial [Nitrososphaerales archaeon]
DIIIILPANPITSIGPILSIPSLRKKIRERRSRCVAVSPIIGREPISGPAKKLMRGLGIEVSVVGVAKLYSDVISKIFIDKKDMRHSDRIRDNNVETHLAKILMKSDEDEKNLAMEILERIQL